MDGPHTTTNIWVAQYTDLAAFLKASVASQITSTFSWV